MVLCLYNTEALTDSTDVIISTLRILLVLLQHPWEFLLFHISLELFQPDYSFLAVSCPIT